MVSGANKESFILFPPFPYSFLNVLAARQENHQA
jgi:hypothetical protein